MHKQIVRENARKVQEWREAPRTWTEQVETRLLNLRMADEEAQKLREMGVGA